MAVRSSAKRLATGAIVLLLVTSVGCVSITQSAKDRIDAPVNCPAASREIEWLQTERSGGPYRVLSVVTGLFPVSAIVLIIRSVFNSPDGAWPDKFRVGFGSFNDKIDEKIERTRVECIAGAS